MIARRPLVALVVLVVLLVAADFVLRAVTERLVAQRVERSLHLSERPSVSLSGFPFLLHFAEGHFASASAKAGGVRSEGVSFGSVTLSLRDIRFPPGKLIFGNGGDVRATTGEGSLDMTGAQATEALRARGTDASVRFAGGKVLVRSPQFPREISATVTVSGNQLVLRSADRALSGSFSVRLPEIIQGLRFTGVGIHGSTAVFRFVLDRPVFRVG